MTISDSAKSANDPTSAMLRLRAATWPAHQRLDQGLDVKRRFANLESYRRHLQQMWGFYASVEQSLLPQSFGGALPDYNSRRKMPLLARDLRALGDSESAIASLTVCSSAPTASNPAAAFGCTYVLEGATLGGQVLLPLVERQLKLTANRGASFLASYGHGVSAMWQKFSAALNEFCDAPDREAAAVEAAVITFERLADWLHREPA